MRDLLVAGGGPVGLAVACHAARAGLDVVVCEPRGAVIDKACGEGLMPGAVAGLNGLGVDPPGLPLLGIRYLAPRHAVQADFSAGPGRGVRRTTLQTALRAAALDAGVEIRQEAVTDVVQDGDGVGAAGVRARYLVAADGLHSPVRRRLGLERAAPPGRRFGLRCHVQTAAWTSYVEVHWSPTCEAYVTPVAPGLVGVALLTGRRGTFDAQLGSFPVLQERLRGQAVSAVLGAGPLHQRSRRRTAGRVLLVGDAAGYVDAITGEGIALGLAQARAAVEAVLSGRPANYEHAWHRITRRYRLITGALVASTRVPVVRRAIVPVAQAWPAAFGAAVEALARPPSGLR